MSANRFQYQPYTEVGKEVTLDQWFQPLSEPVRVVPRPVREGGLAWQREIPAEADRLPGKAGAIVIGYKQIRQYQAKFAPVLVPFVSVFNPSTLEWIAKYPDRVYGKAPLRQQGIIQFFTPRLPELPGWYQPASEPVRRKPRPIIVDPALVLDEFVVNPGILDRWFQPASEPVRGKPRWTYTYPSVADQDLDQPEPRLESWNTYSPEPVRLVRQWLYAGPFDTRTELGLAPAAVAPDLSWNAQYPNFILGRVPTYLVGPSLFWYSETGPDVSGGLHHVTRGRSAYKHRHRDSLKNYLPEG